MTCSHSGKECKRGHLCEWCPVPNAYGFFLKFDKNNRAIWEQRFILEADRSAIIAGLDAKIAELQEQKVRIMSIPKKEI